MLRAAHIINDSRKKEGNSIAGNSIEKYIHTFNRVSNFLLPDRATKMGV